jgi:catechol 2,3-dioxygenase-like lactoylglutathione lyase family enzyme
VVDERKAFVVSTVNHLSYPSRDYKVTRDFYVSLFGLHDVWDDGAKCQLDCGPEDAPNSFYMTAARPGSTESGIAHFSFGLPDFWKLTGELRNELLRRALPGVRPDGEAGWFVNGPSGWVQHIVTVKDPAMFPGAARPCADARSEACRAAYAAGLRGLDSRPKPEGKSFRALYFKYIVLHVPDIAREADFYTSLMGMKPVSQKMDHIALRFGENTLVLRPSGPDGKPYCNEFGFVIDDYDASNVKAALTRRHIAWAPNPESGLMLRDPNGLLIGIAGK